MKAVFVIIDYSLASKLNQTFQKENLPFKLTTHGHGSAESELLELLGLGENKKMVAITLIDNDKVIQLYKRLDKEMNLRKAGAGVAFSVPIDSISKSIAVICQMEKNNEQKEKEIMSDAPFELIITIVSRGYFEVVKNAAKFAGARGGTLIHGLGIGGEEAAKFLGIKIQPEKDIILMVVNAANKQKVMQKIIEDAGILKESRGICFSIPVDSTFGMSDEFSD